MRLPLTARTSVDCPHLPAFFCSRPSRLLMGFGESSCTRSGRVARSLGCTSGATEGDWEPAGAGAAPADEWVGEKEGGREEKAG